MLNPHKRVRAPTTHLILPALALPGPLRERVRAGRARVAPRALLIHNLLVSYKSAEGVLVTVFIRGALWLIVASVIRGPITLSMNKIYAN